MRELSEAAKAAKLIRQELKAAFPNIKFKVRSSNFSMGNAVDIGWKNGVIEKKVNTITSKYQYGHFDGMNDIYEYSNGRDDIPQAKYISTSRTIDDSIYEEAFNHAKNYYAFLENAKSLNSYIQNYGTVGNFLWRILNQMDLSNGFDFEQFKQIA